MVEKVVPLVEGADWEAKRSRKLRAVAGFSDAGRGAAFLATRFTSIFGGVVSFFAWCRDTKLDGTHPHGVLLDARCVNSHALLIAEDTLSFAEACRNAAVQAGCPADRIQRAFHYGKHDIARITELFPTHAIPFLRETLHWPI